MLGAAADLTQEVVPKQAISPENKRIIKCDTDNYFKIKSIPKFIYFLKPDDFTNKAGKYKGH